MGTTNLATLVLSIICITYLIIFKEFVNPRIKKKLKLEFPSELLLVRDFLIKIESNEIVKCDVKKGDRYYNFVDFYRLREKISYWHCGNYTQRVLILVC